MELEILDIKKENLEELLPELMSLEHNWTELGEASWTADNFRMELPKKWEFSFYAAQEGKMVGYVIGSINNGPGKINKILVDRNLRGNGIATILWNEFLRRCRENKLKLADFRALTDNQPALNFYKKQKCIFYGSTKGTDGLIREDIKYVFNTKRINHSKPTIDSEDINKFLEAMNTGNLATGKIVKEFEESLSKYIGKKFGVATNSGTNALYLALRALDVKEGDEVILPSYICGSVLNAVSYCRATPIVVDINEDDYNISFEQTKNKITEKTKAIILPHMFGNPVKDIEKFLELRVPIIEDCAMSIGAEHNGKKIGNFGEISIFSFYATKMIASGVGGMVLTSDEKIYSRFLDLMQYDNRENFDESYNYKMSDLQAALGLSQLKKLDSFVRKRKEIASRYNHLLENGNSEFNLPKTGENIFFRYIIQCRDKETDIDTFIEQIRKRGVDVAKPIYKPLHNYLALPDRDFPNTAKAYKTAISIPIYPNLTDSEIEDVASILLNHKEERGEIK